MTTKIFIYSDEAGIDVEAQFNPETISLKKSSGANRSPQSTEDSEKLSYKGGSQFSLSMKLIFDTTEYYSNMSSSSVFSGDDVHYRFVGPLFSLMKIGNYDGELRPPRCTLDWGSSYLTWNGSVSIMKTCYVEKVDADYTYFDQYGLPLRATADVTLKQIPEDLGSQNPTTLTIARKTWLVRGNETLDWIAYKEYGDPAQWRYIAETNNLDNPLSLSPGQLLRIMPLPE